MNKQTKIRPSCDESKISLKWGHKETDGKLFLWIDNEINASWDSNSNKNIG